MSYSSVILADSPIVYYRLGEPSGTVADNAQGTATRDGTYASVTLGVTGLLTGDTDTAMTVDGSIATTPKGVWIDTAAADFPYGAAARSFEFWIKATHVYNGPVIRYGNAGVNGCIELSVWGTTGGDGGAAGGDGRLRCYNTTSEVNLTDASVSDGATHHIVCDYSGTTWTAYVDGVAQTPVAQTLNTIATGGWPCRLGTDAQYYYNYNLAGTLDEVAVYSGVLGQTKVSAHYAAGATVPVPVWTTPADTVSMSTTPDLKFTSPASAVAQHFQLQLDTANTFDSGNLRTYDSSTSQANWTYWDGSAWQAMPSGGLLIAYAGNEVDYTVTSALSGSTWYRRVRAGTLV